MMGTKRDAQGKPNPTPATTVTQGSDEIVVASAPAPKNRKKALIAGLVLLAAAIISLIIVWFMSQGNNAEDVKLKTGDAVTGQIDAMSDDEINSVAGNKVDANENFDAAYARALALSQQDKNDEALKELEALIATGKAKYYVYVDYALVQARANKLNESIKTMEQALTMLAKDNSISNDVKTSESRYLNNKLEGLKDEASS